MNPAERRGDADRRPARVSLARLPYREPAPELAAAVDRFLAVRDLMPTSRRSYRQVLTAVTAAAGPTRPVGDLDAGDLAAALTASYGAAAAATWNRAATIVPGFAGWCAEQGWTAEDQLPRLAYEAAVVVDPPVQDAVEHSCQVGEGLVTASGDARSGSPGSSS